MASTSVRSIKRRRVEGSDQVVSTPSTAAGEARDAPNIIEQPLNGPRELPTYEQDPESERSSQTNYTSAPEIPDSRGSNASNEEEDGKVPQISSAQKMAVRPKITNVGQRSRSKDHMQKPSRSRRRKVSDSQSPTPDRLKPHWRGWVEVQEGQPLPANNQDQFEAIRRAAMEAVKGGDGMGGRKSLRERKSTGHAESSRKARADGAAQNTSQAKERRKHQPTEETKANKHSMHDKKAQRKSETQDGRATKPLDSLSAEVTTPKRVKAKRTTEKGITDGHLLPQAEREPGLDLSHAADEASPAKREADDGLVEKANELEKLLAEDLDALETIKAEILARLTSRPCMNSGPEYEKVHQIVSQTVLAGEGNSMLIIGPRGTGKTAIVESAISDLQQDYKEDFHVVRLNGFFLTDDKIALKEIWKQLGREMNVEDELATGRNNYADILTSLLALLSHEEAPSADEQSSHQRPVAKSVIFILDEFHHFASHPRQTLLYNLFDLAQSSTTPLAVIGLTTRTDAIDMLEKRVKSRFGQRIVQLTPPRALAAFKDICRDALLFHPQSASDFSSKLFEHAKPNTSLARISEAWNAYIPHLLSHPQVHHHIDLIFSTTRQPSTFFNSALLPILSLSQTSPILTPMSFTPSTSLLQPDSSLTLILPSLSTLAFSLLISAARLEIILAPTATSLTGISRAAIAGPVGVNFETVYAEYLSLATRSRANASVAGQVGVGGGRVWGKAVARGEWERLVDLKAVVSATGGGRGGGGDHKFVVDLGGLEEIGAWIEQEGKANGVPMGLGKWCRI